ncbi:hypothetical protein D770_07030 [Flammeovirgaceae bacterium 311]|nr:hypothetical protein D770_07030 [Flammeovirgaceae bacterium 311]
MDEKEEESFGKELQKFLMQKIRELGQWVKPDPTDNLFLQIIKIFFKSIVLLLLTAFSPVVVLFLIGVFIGGL